MLYSALDNLSQRLRFPRPSGEIQAAFHNGKALLPSSPHHDELDRHQRCKDGSGEQHGVAAERRQQYEQRSDRTHDACFAILGAIVEKPQTHQENRDGNSDGRSCGDTRYFGVMSRVVDGDRQPGTDRRRGSKDEVVAITPDDGFAQAGEQIVDRTIESTSTTWSRR